MDVVMRLNVYQFVPNRVYFSSAPEEKISPNDKEGYYMTLEHWERLGRPGEIKISIVINPNSVDADWNQGELILTRVDQHAGPDLTDIFD